MLENVRLTNILLFTSLTRYMREQEGEYPKEPSGFGPVSEAMKSNDKDRLRKEINDFLNDETATNPYEIYLAGMYAARDLGDESLVDRAIEKEKRLNSWGHVVRLYGAWKKDLLLATEAKNSQFEYLLSRGEYDESLEAIIETKLVPDDQRGPYLRRIYTELLNHDEFLEAAFLAKKYRTYGFSEDEILDSAKRAYQQAQKHPIQELDEDDTISITDAPLIAREFGLDQNAFAV